MVRTARTVVLNHLGERESGMSTVSPSTGSLLRKMTQPLKKTKPKNKINDRNDQQLPHSTRDPFPPLPSGRDVPGFRKIQEQKAEQTQSFSGQNVTELVKTICKFLNFDQFWIDMIVKVIPLLTALWNKLTSLSTALETPQPL